MRPPIHQSLIYPALIVTVLGVLTRMPQEALAKKTAVPDPVTAYRDEIFELVKNRKLQEAIGVIDYGVQSGVLERSNLRLIRCWVLLLDLQMQQSAACLDQYSKSKHNPDPDILINYNKVTESLRIVQTILDAYQAGRFEEAVRLISAVDVKTFWRLELYREKALQQINKTRELITPTPARPSSAVPWWRSAKVWAPLGLASSVALGVALTLGITPRSSNAVVWQEP